MKKLIKVSVKTNNEVLKNNYQAIIIEDKIKYLEDDNTKVEFNLKTNILKRENNELKMRYRFIEKEDTKGNIYIKDINKEFIIDIKTTSIKKDLDKIEINYQIEQDKFKYLIDWR